MMKVKLGRVTILLIMLGEKRMRWSTRMDLERHAISDPTGLVRVPVGRMGWGGVILGRHT